MSGCESCDGSGIISGDFFLDDYVLVDGPDTCTCPEGLYWQEAIENVLMEGLE